MGPSRPCRQVTCSTGRGIGRLDGAVQPATHNEQKEPELLAYLEHLGATGGARARRCGLAILHGNGGRILHLSLRLALDAIGFHHMTSVERMNDTSAKFALVSANPSPMSTIPHIS